jgi:hypothetical protein
MHTNRHESLRDQSKIRSSSRLNRRSGSVNFPQMSMLAEIEAAVDALSLEQKQELLRFLASRVNGADAEKDLTDLTQFSEVIRLPEDPLAWQRRVRGESE